MAETKKTAAELYAQAQAAQQQLEQLRQQQPGAYESAYGAQIDALMAQLDSRPAFTYDINGDPLFRQYQEQYQRQGKAAMEDTMGTAAGLTGGYGNSYATTAASQAYQKLNPPLPISAPSPAISTVPGRIKPTSASDARKATNTTAINEYTVDWVIKCASNACIMCPVDEFVVDCAKWWYSGQSILCMNILLQRESFRV